MKTIISIVMCPLCGGKMVEHLHDDGGAEYACKECGYGCVFNGGTAYSNPEIPQAVTIFTQEAGVTRGHGWMRDKKHPRHGRFLLWPVGRTVEGEYKVVPLRVEHPGQPPRLLWERWDAVPPGGHRYGNSRLYQDFKEACEGFLFKALDLKGGCMMPFEGFICKVEKACGE